MLQTNQMLDNRLPLWRSDKYIQLDERLYNKAKRIEETTERNYNFSTMQAGKWQHAVCPFLLKFSLFMVSGPLLVVESGNFKFMALNCCFLFTFFFFWSARVWLLCPCFSVQMYILNFFFFSFFLVLIRSCDCECVNILE